MTDDEKARVMERVVEAAWAATCSVLYRDPEARRWFEEETGAVAPLEGIIPLSDVITDPTDDDEDATRPQYARAFIDWFTIRRWGVAGAPRRWLEDYARRRAAT